MLVLSRKENQEIIFPNLGIKVEVLKTDGRTVRVGIDAPRDIQILRGELCDGERSEPPRAATSKPKLGHADRNRLNEISLSLTLMQKQMELGLHEDAEASLGKALAKLQDVEQAAGKVAAKTGKPRRALVVEDNANERELLAGYLRLCGYEVDTADDGLAALRFLREHQVPEVMFVDMQMPRLNGEKTVSAIRADARYRGMKLFAVTGQERKHTNVDVGARGVDHWFMKPVKPSELATAVDNEIVGRDPMLVC